MEWGVVYRRSCGGRDLVPGPGGGTSLSGSLMVG